MIKQLSLVLMIFLVAACATTQVESTREASTSTKALSSQSRDVQSLLMEADRSNESTAALLRVQAASQSIAMGDVLQAKRILEVVNDPFRDSKTGRIFLMTEARIAIAEENGRQALEYLNDRRLQNIPLTQNLQIELGKLRSESYRLGRSYVASARERIYLDPLLTTEERAENHERIFSALLLVPAKSLVNHADKAITSDLRGWLSLAAMTKQYQNDPLRQLQELNNWKQLWSHHPAASQLPASLVMLSRVVKEQPSSIALLLPVLGELGAYGRAIRDGVLAAHYEQRNNTVINIYDTSNADISELIQLAVSNGAELIIGPLSRDKVETLSNIKLPVPVIALNHAYNQPVSTGMINTDLYQFGLAPEDEMIQVAERVWKDGHQKALVIIPEGSWGDRNLDTFKRHWESLGGLLVEETRFSNQRDYSDIVKFTLKVDQSEKRSSDLRRMIGQRFEFTPRRRQDIDAIFLLANPAQARGINPTLAFFYADDIPVYASSHVHELNKSRIDTIDLNGIRFCDIPWKLTTTDKLQNTVQELWESANSNYAPFYALGIDAYRLYPRLQQLKEIPDEKLFGTTGVLTLRNNTVVRRLMWAQFINGNVSAMPLVLGNQ